MRRTTLIRVTVFAVALLAAGSAVAQLGNPAGMTPETMHDPPGEPSPARANVQDRLFVQLMGAGGIAEVQAADAALERARSDAVRSFAQRMRQAHSQANARLATLAEAAAIPMPSAPMPDQAQDLARLQSNEDRIFDAAWLQNQLVEHQKATQLLIWQIGQGQNRGLQQFASATLPEVIAHLEAVQRLLAEQTTTGPQGLAGR